MINHKDKGFRGTKFVMALIAMAINVAAFAATGIWPGLEGAYPVLVGAIDGLAALYMGGNAASQYVAAKHGPKEPAVVGQPEADEPPPRAK